MSDCNTKSKVLAKKYNRISQLLYAVPTYHIDKNEKRVRCANKKLAEATGYPTKTGCPLRTAGKLINLSKKYYFLCAIAACAAASLAIGTLNGEQDT